MLQKETAEQQAMLAVSFRVWARGWNRERTERKVLHQEAAEQQTLLAVSFRVWARGWNRERTERKVLHQEAAEQQTLLAVSFRVWARGWNRERTEQKVEVAQQQKVDNKENDNKAPPNKETRKNLRKTPNAHDTLLTDYVRPPLAQRPSNKTPSTANKTGAPYSPLIMSFFVDDSAGASSSSAGTRVVNSSAASSSSSVVPSVDGGDVGASALPVGDDDAAFVAALGENGSGDLCDGGGDEIEAAFLLARRPKPDLKPSTTNLAASSSSSGGGIFGGGVSGGTSGVRRFDRSLDVPSGGVRERADRRALVGTHGDFDSALRASGDVDFSTPSTANKTGAPYSRADVAMPMPFFVEDQAYGYPVHSVRQPPRSLDTKLPRSESTPAKEWSSREETPSIPTGAPYSRVGSKGGSDSSILGGSKGGFGAESRRGSAGSKGGVNLKGGMKGGSMTVAPNKGSMKGGSMAVSNKGIMKGGSMAVSNEGSVKGGSGACNKGSMKGGSMAVSNEGSMAVPSKTPTPAKELRANRTAGAPRSRVDVPIVPTPFFLSGPGPTDYSRPPLDYGYSNYSASKTTAPSKKNDYSASKTKAPLGKSTGTTPSIPYAGGLPSPGTGTGR